MFECDKCGSCCKNLKKIGEYFDLDRGDGICKYLKKIYARFMIPDL